MKLHRMLALALTAALLVPLARFASAQDVKDSAAAAIAAAAAVAPKADAPRKRAAKPKKKAVKRKKKPESKYKTRALSRSVVEHYRFDADGNAIVGGKKKTAAKAKKKSSSVDPEDKPACTEDAPCSDKNSSDADAL